MFSLYPFPAQEPQHTQGFWWFLPWSLSAFKDTSQSLLPMDKMQQEPDIPSRQEKNSGIGDIGELGKVIPQKRGESMAIPVMLATEQGGAPRSSLADT